MKKTLLLLVFSALLSSCSDYSQERKEVADLMDQIDESQKNFDDLTEKGLPMTTNDIFGRLDVISNDYTRRGEVFDKDLAIQLAEFKAFKKMFKGLGGKRTQIREGLELCRTQLKDLDNDLKNKSLDKKKVEKYLDDERIACKAVTASVVEMQGLYNRSGKAYLERRAKIDSVITSLGLSYPN
jgi:hypothetical protein